MLQTQIELCVSFASQKKNTNKSSSNKMENICNEHECTLIFEPISQVEELILHMLQFLSLHDLMQYCLVCSKWNKVIQGSEHLWKIQSEELGWSKSYALQQMSREPAYIRESKIAKSPLNQLLSDSFLSQENHLTNSELASITSWKQFYKLLKVGTANLYLYINSHLMRPHCVALLQQATGLDVDTINREFGGSDNGEIIVCYQEPLIHCLKMDRKLKKINPRIMTGLVPIENNFLPMNQPYKPINFHVEAYSTELEQLLKKTLKDIKMSDSKFAVSILNDDNHSFDQVIRQLRIATKIPYDVADRITWKAHANGECICFESENLDACFPVLKNLNSIGLECRLRVLKTDFMYNLIRLFNEGCDMDEEQKKGESIQANKERDEGLVYHVMLSRNGYYDSQQVLEDYVRILSLTSDEAIRTMLFVYSTNSYCVFQGTFAECEKIYKEFDKRLYNVTLRSAAELEIENGQAYLRNSFADYDSYESASDEGIDDYDDYVDLDYIEDMGLTEEQEQQLEQNILEQLDRDNDYPDEDEDIE
jgi:ATP-dependent Clp protease adapter protein ClpS